MAPLRHLGARLLVVRDDQRTASHPWCGGLLGKATPAREKMASDPNAGVQRQLSGMISENCRCDQNVNSKARHRAESRICLSRSPGGLSRQGFFCKIKRCCTGFDNGVAGGSRSASGWEVVRE